MKRGKIPLIITILVASSLLSPTFIHPGRAATLTGKVCLADPSTANLATPCPSTPPIFDGPIGQQIRIGVYINGSGGLGGFTVILNANHTILLPVGIDLSGSVLQSSNGPPQIFAECLNGLLLQGPACSAADNPDTLDLSAGVALGAGNTLSPTTGLLFTAIYNISSSVSSTTIGFQTSSQFCGNSSVVAAGGGPICVLVSSPPSANLLPETVETATFANSNSATMASITVSASPISFGPEFPGTSNTTTVTATANNGFPGIAVDSVLFTVTAPTGLSASITGTNPCATNGNSCSSTINLSPTSAGIFNARVLGTYETLDPSGNPDTLVASVAVTVISDDFTFKATPSHISFPSGSNASSTLTLSSLNGFVGTITLSKGAVAPATPPLTVTLVSNAITLSAGQTSTAAVIFTASPTVTTLYHAQIRATFGTRVKTILENVTATVAIPDFAISASPTVVSSKPNVSGFSVIAVSSLNGFKGTVSLSASSNSTSLACSLNATSITNGSGMSNLSCSGSAGNYLVTVTGTSGTLVHSISIVFNVFAPSPGGVVCIAQSGSTTCPFTPPLLNFTSPIPGQLRVAVVVSNSSALSGFDIILLTNHTILQPVGIDLTGTILHGPPQILAECFSGRLVQGSACNPQDTVDTLELAATSAIGSPPTNPPTTGLLFTAIFNITNPSPGTALDFQSGCSNTSVAGGVCITIANPITGAPDVESAQGAIVSTSTLPDFVLTASPNFLTVKAGSSVTSLLSVSSVNGFMGTVNLNGTAQSATIAVSVSPSSLTLAGGQTLSSTITITPSMFASAGNYSITVTGTSGSLTHIVTLVVFVFVPPPPDFGISAIPSFLIIQAGNQATSTIFLTSIGGFQGTITVFESSAVLSVGINTTLVPNSVTLSANGSATVILTILTSTFTPASFNSITITATSGALSHGAFFTVQVTPPPDEPPVAQFNVSPPSPVVGQQATFDASGSFDPDGFIEQYEWSFGDASGIYVTTSTIISHSFFSPGNFTVTLTVFDSSGLTASTSHTVHVIPQPAHDVSVNELFVFTNVAVSTQKIFFEVLIANQGSSTENVTLVLYANGHPVSTETGIILPACSGNCFEFFVETTWDTTGVVPGSYTMSATVFLPPGETDPTPQDNSITDGIITILPPPVLVVTPSTSAVGDKITIKGTGFSAPSQFSQTHFIEVTFDDMLSAFVTTTNGTFTITIDVPLSQPGMHLIKAFDESDSAHAATTFQVLPNQAPIVVTVDTGAIYFPGDTATIYILTTTNGTKIGPAGVQLQVSIVYPNGTIRTLNPTSVSTGLYTAVYKIPSKASLGTYSVIAVAHMTGAIDGSAIAGFEVQPTWISSHSSQIASGAAIAGVLGFVGFAWQKGYFRRRKETKFPEMI